MKAVRLLAVATCCVLVAPAASAQRLAKPAVDTIAHGVVRVRNTGPSGWLGTSGWKFVLEHTVSADGGKAVLAEPVSLAVDRAGRIIETDWRVDGLQVFEPDGRFARIIGRTGDGPGEFRPPVSIAISGDTIVAFADNQRRMSIWSVAGKLLAQWPAVYCCTGSPPVLEARGTILIAGSFFGGRGFVRLRRDGKAVDTMRIPATPDVREWVGKEGNWTIPFTAWTLGTFDGQGRYISGNSVHYTLFISLHGLDTVRVIELPGKRTPVSVQAADSVFAPFTKRAPINQIAKRGDIPTEQPFFTGLIADEHNNIWIGRPAANGLLSAFDVIDPDGRFLGTVAAPPRPCGLNLFRNDRMYCVADTPDGDKVIQVYRIDRTRP